MVSRYKVKKMKRITKLLIILTMMSAISLGQGGPPNGFPTGGNGGGPPPPPPTYCDQNPGDPACNGTAVPVGDWKWMIGTFLLGTAFVFYKFKNKPNEI
jgi:hypothetical protein